MNRITHFEIYTDDPEAVQPFYKDVFGWKFQKFEGGPIEYWLITTGPDSDPGINGGLTRPREDLRAENGDSESWLACLRRRSSRQCFRSHRTG